MKSLSQNRFKKLQLEHVAFKRVFFFSNNNEEKVEIFGTKFNFLFKQTYIKKNHPTVI